MHLVKLWRYWNRSEALSTLMQVASEFAQKLWDALSINFHKNTTTMVETLSPGDFGVSTETFFWKDDGPHRRNASIILAAMKARTVLARTGKVITILQLQSARRRLLKITRRKAWELARPDRELQTCKTLGEERRSTRLGLFSEAMMCTSYPNRDRLRRKWQVISSTNSS